MDDIKEEKEKVLSSLPETSELTKDDSYIISKERDKFSDTVEKDKIAEEIAKKALAKQQQEDEFNKRAGFDESKKALEKFFEYKYRNKKITLSNFLDRGYWILTKYRPDFSQLAGGNPEKQKDLYTKYLERLKPISDRYVKEVGLYCSLLVVNEIQNENGETEELPLFAMEPYFNRYFHSKNEDGEGKDFERNYAIGGIATFSNLGYAGPLSDAFKAFGDNIIAGAATEGTKDRELLVSEISNNHALYSLYNTGKKGLTLSSDHEGIESNTQDPSEGNNTVDFNDDFVDD